MNPRNIKKSKKLKVENESTNKDYVSKLTNVSTEPRSQLCPFALPANLKTVCKMSALIPILTSYQSDVTITMEGLLLVAYFPAPHSMYILVPTNSSPQIIPGCSVGVRFVYCLWILAGVYVKLLCSITPFTTSMFLLTWYIFIIQLQ